MLSPDNRHNSRVFSSGPFRVLSLAVVSFVLILAAGIFVFSFQSQPASAAPAQTLNHGSQWQLCSSDSNMDLRSTSSPNIYISWNFDAYQSTYASGDTFTLSDNENPDEVPHYFHPVPEDNDSTKEIEACGENCSPTAATATQEAVWIEIDDDSDFSSPEVSYSA